MLLLALLAARPALAEDGYDLWLRYRAVEQPLRQRYAASASTLVIQGSSPTLDAARAELQRGLEGLLGRAPSLDRTVARDGAIVIGTPANSPLVAGLNLPLQPLGPEGYLIRSARLNGRSATVIAANSDIGALYGAFHLLRLIQTRQSLGSLDIVERPLIERRMLNHWDDLDRHVIRGYAGLSLWDWQKLPTFLDPR